MSDEATGGQGERGHSAQPSAGRGDQYQMIKGMPHLPSEAIISKSFLQRGVEGVVLWDVVPLQKENRIRIEFKKKNSNWNQGVLLMSNNGIKIDNEIYQSPIEIWFVDNAKYELTCYSDNGLLHVYNIWGRGKGRESQSWTSGMKITQNGNIRLYQCNDIGYTERFDKLTLSITIY